MKDEGSKPHVIALCNSMVAVFGAERIAFAVISLLIKNGYSCHCLLNNWENHKIVKLAEQCGATWEAFSRNWRLQRKAPLIHWMRILWDFSKANSKLLWLALKQKPSHILAPEFDGILRHFVALGLLRLFNIKVILILPTPPATTPFYKTLWRRLILPFTDRVVCNSYYNLGELRKISSATSKQRVVYNITSVRSTPAFSASPKHKDTIVYIGQIIPEKGVQELVLACGSLLEAGYDMHVHIIGPINTWEPPSSRGYQASVMQLVIDRNWGHAITFEGFQENVHDWLVSATIHCCPSLPKQKEAFGLVVLEAKLAGIPSVVFPTGALPELVTHKVNGFVCDAITPEALAEGVQYFLENPSARKSAGMQAQAHGQCLNRYIRFEQQWLQVFRG